FKLVNYFPSVFGLPLPNPLDKGLSAQLISVLALFCKLSFDNILSCYACVVSTGHPQHIVSGHPFPPGKYVLQGSVERMSHVKGTGNIRRRDNNAEWGLVRVR